jgi:predicted dehydrogenase
MALWVLEGTSVTSVSSHLFARGKPLTGSASQVEDFALAELQLSSGAVVRLACSWNLPAGCDAVIEAAFFGEAGGAMLSNVNGSFYDFTADRFRGTARERLSSPPDDWGGRAIVDWATRLSAGAGYDPSAEQLVEVAGVLDAIYGRGAQPGLTLTHQAAPTLARAGVP